MLALSIPSSWVLADSFESVPNHSEPPLRLWDVELAHLLDYVSCSVCEGEGCAAYGDTLTLCGRCGGMGEVLDLTPPFPIEPDPAELSCETCYGFGWLTERGCSPWYRKTRTLDPVMYELLHEHLDVSSVPCPVCLGVVQAA